MEGREREDREEKKKTVRGERDGDISKGKEEREREMGREGERGRGREGGRKRGGGREREREREQI